MLEGQIIKFYRERQNMMQQDLGIGICSRTHISKIERGLTEVSQETIGLLSERLGIDMEIEIKTYNGIDSILKKWHESIILKLKTKAKNLKEQLEAIALLHMPDIYRSYTLVLTRYYLLIGQGHQATSLIAEMDKWSDLSPYEKNMLLHIKGINALMNKEYYKAISYFQGIDLTYYNNQEYYYHLAFAYHSLNSRVLAYYFAEKSLRFFTEVRSFTRMIEAEMLMLVQVERDEFYDPKDTEYQRLIEMTENIGLDHQRAMLTHNLAYQKVRQGNYDKASEYYKQSMDIKDPHTALHIASLEGYINALTKQGLKSTEKLLQLVEKGIALSEEITEPIYLHFFYLHKYNLQNEKELYYHYLEKEAFPYYQKMAHVRLSEHYAIKLFDYHMEKGNVEEANQYAAYLVEKYRRNDKFA
ncbi:helix-turn-helix domain-containing protein [Peribacillus alkalitolerans]|uniref:helix-turn-helix domain-containing protein n=1 Tax=Peribacillus alkalitolerans TaxID=1550385 RepID=UPI0013CF6DB9|nr:helix-turn-helix transcriptional regulator [Peribacillus alkalitolerans]